MQVNIDCVRNATCIFKHTLLLKLTFLALKVFNQSAHAFAGNRTQDLSVVHAVFYVLSYRNTGFPSILPLLGCVCKQTGCDIINLA